MVCQWALQIQLEGLFCFQNPGKRKDHELNNFDMKGGTGDLLNRKNVNTTGNVSRKWGIKRFLLLEITNNLDAFLKKCPTNLSIRRLLCLLPKPEENRKT
jgi:hypothetical protein